MLPVSQFNVAQPPDYNMIPYSPNNFYPLPQGYQAAAAAAGGNDFQYVGPQYNRNTYLPSIKDMLGAPGQVPARQNDYSNNNNDYIYGNPYHSVQSNGNVVPMPGNVVFQQQAYYYSTPNGVMPYMQPVPVAGETRIPEMQMVPTSVNGSVPQPAVSQPPMPQPPVQPVKKITPPPHEEFPVIFEQFPMSPLKTNSKGVNKPATTTKLKTKRRRRRKSSAKNPNRNINSELTDLVAGSERIQQPPTTGPQRYRSQAVPFIKCKHCQETETPEWRRGPYGNRSLCNACGLYYRKLIKSFDTKNGNLIMRFNRMINPQDRKVPVSIHIPRNIIKQLDRDPTLDVNYFTVD
ncbi:Gat2p KNAG_0E02120 [Huiozyma naganishii CBS 8797]|uniref:GATA-type domain-containing protein n=1 Tax=Huiozyma naganishii (strain ATCC MYA-139 / BCRC 22969 / CBS 8797 / KCTC 17520 / NBRC 10181 / NCYC 3082 / Yp74L-3) TaxID=1071383 RepID=J7S6N9_HUIN7|nr:hypothetical protein KNAG_0E02120 [Kazachstania naganishii CBS 8797]CCK70474.1 hypothetical protein KNAG_0E02120 [Kazachstania naganishii CBS 8797]